MAQQRHPDTVALRPGIPGVRTVRVGSDEFPDGPGRRGAGFRCDRIVQHDIAVFLEEGQILRRQDGRAGVAMLGKSAGERRINAGDAAGVDCAAIVFQDPLLEPLEGGASL